MKSIRQLLLCLVPLLLWGDLPLAAAEDPLFIGDVEKEKDAWLDKTFQVEGRVIFIDRSKFKFRNSSILFESKADLQEFNIKPVNLQVVGRLRKIRGDYKFDVSSIEPARSDADQLARKRLELDRNDPRSFYDLADWTRKRGEFYQESQLNKSADDLLLQGFQQERSRLKPDDSDARLALAEKGKQIGISLSVREELIHEAFRGLITSTARLPQPDWGPLAEMIARDLPGAKDELSLTPVAIELMRDYLATPTSVYQNADQPSRLQLHRILWGEVKRLELLDSAKRDPTRGTEFADQLGKTLPEYGLDAEKMLDDLLEQRGSEVLTLTRRELIDLRDNYLERGKPLDADRVVTLWIASRKKRLKENDLEGLLQLASDYDALSRDASELAPSLVAAALAYPDSKEIASALGKLGYRLKDGKWLSPEERNQLSNSVHQQELREGLVSIGMTASEVRKSQGIPGSLTRISTNGELREIWSYGGRPGIQTGFTIYFRKGSLDPQPVVFAINDLKTK